MTRSQPRQDLDKSAPAEKTVSAQIPRQEQATRVQGSRVRKGESSTR